MERSGIAVQWSDLFDIHFVGSSGFPLTETIIHLPYRLR